MMKPFLLLLVIGLTLPNAYAQDDCNIVDEYKKIFKIEKEKYGERTFLMKTVNKLGPGSCFSDLINNNDQYIDYLRTHFSDNSNHEKLMAITDTIELQNTFIKALEKDSAFNEVMYKLTEKVTAGSEFVPDTVSIDELLNIAVKYFSIIKINEDGYLS